MDTVDVQLDHEQRIRQLEACVDHLAKNLAMLSANVNKHPYYEPAQISRQYGIGDGWTEQQRDDMRYVLHHGANPPARKPPE